MKRMLFDTNIYGRIVGEKEEEKVKELLDKNHNIIIYGFDVVRKELRALSQEVISGRKRIRLVLLGLYDRLVKSHVYQTTSPMRQLVEDYYKTYKELGGKRSEKEMLNDFLIVACASLHELDVVVSEDNKTMLSVEALKAYKIVNNLRKYKTPVFLGYGDFKRLISL
ncbi:hypothetical protein HY642_05190 [Candidatus Woesearchaeota archaeon]|nr:hypothetical protein [Candidatus Woesearchaeota archaeon]